jgi:hypothetical protein
MHHNKMFKWWVVIEDGSWLTKTHGAFSLNFLTANQAVSADKKGHMHCSRC